MGMELVLAIIGTTVGVSGLGFKLLETLVKIDRKMEKSLLSIEELRREILTLAGAERGLAKKLEDIEGWLIKNTTYQQK